MRKKITDRILNKVKEDYTLIASDFDRTRRKQESSVYPIMLDFIKNNDVFVDLGCGNGRAYDYISKHKNIRYIGIDNNKRLLEKAREQFTEKFIEGDFLNLPLEAELADVALAGASLHHIPSKVLRIKALSEAYRILKPNGIFIVTVWNLFQPKYKKYIWKARLKWLLSLGGYDSRDTFIPWRYTNIKRYYYAFTPKELKCLLEKNGFKILKSEVSKDIIFICQKKQNK